MRLLSVFLLTACLHVSAGSYSQSISYAGREVPLIKLFAVIKKQTGYVVWGKSDLLKLASPVSVSAKNMPLVSFLDQVMKDQPFNYRIAGNTIMLYERPVTAAPAQPAPEMATRITGTVTDSTGAPLAGATVEDLTTGISEVTNAQGAFAIAVSEGDKLRISFIGYRTKELVISRLAIRQGVIGRLTLGLSSVNLTEMNVTANTGYQNIPKERATGAFGIVTEKTLATRLENNLMDRLEGTVAGLFIYNGDVTIRGQSTLYANTAPLYVVDGYPYEGDLGYINPADVVNVTVMKDAAAASIYGTRAANGVISITTRQGSSKKMTINFGTSMFMAPKPDYGSMDMLNSRQMVDLQQELFNMWHPTWSDLTRRTGMPKAIDAMYNYEQNLITKTTLDSTLNSLRNADGRDQVKRYLMRNRMNQRYYFSADGGNEVHQYNMMMNYTKNKEYGLNTGGDYFNLGVKERVKVFKWLDANGEVATNLTNSTYNTEYPDMFFTSSMPYEVVKNPDGSLAPWTKLKSPYEIQRLKSLGLPDETYNPLSEQDNGYSKANNIYFRLQGGLTFRIIPGLQLDLKYQTERYAGHQQRYYGPDSWYTKDMINDAAQVINGQLILNVPNGGQMYDARYDQKSYTARAQLNFDRQFGSAHRVTVLAGGERRAIASSSTSVFRMGYSDNNLLFQPVDQIGLGNLKGTEALGSTFSLDYSSNNNFSYTEERYISVYGNAGYTFRNRYNLTGSVRVDNSNLFGTDPRYRYLPLWSAGASWRLSEENFMKDLHWLNRLTLRGTYGLGGNVARTAGPFLQAKSSFFSEARATATDIVSPPNKSLRWEKTASTNFGLDFAILNNRISGTVDYYIRHTSDLLGYKATDPTNAFVSALINYGSMRNRGFEFTLNTQNVRSKNFSWNTTLALSINKNRMTKITNVGETIYALTGGYGVTRVGYPMNAMFNFRYAGLDPTNGSVLLYDAAGKLVKNYDQTGAIVANMQDINGLVYSGTMTPVYTAGFTNSFTWKRLTLNVIIIANGGNVFRDVVPSISLDGIRPNMDSRVANFWRKPGDEKNPATTPAPDLKGTGAGYTPLIWFASDRNTLKADYIKVRDISLAYNFPPASIGLKKLNAARVMVQVQNPFHWYRNKPGIDPEAYDGAAQYANRRLPVTPVYMAGLDITF